MKKNALRIIGIGGNPKSIEILVGKKRISFIKIKKNLMWREIIPSKKGKKKEWISGSRLDEAYKLARENLFTNSKTTAAFNLPEAL